MSMIIEEYYKQKNLPAILIKKKMVLFEKHKDIAKEFENWLNTGKYSEDNPVCVEGYTAKDISILSPRVDGEGAFFMLIELREDANKAKKSIENGFKIK